LTALRLCLPVRLPALAAARRNELAILENPKNHALGMAAMARPEREFAALVTSKRWKPGRVLTIAFRGGRVVDRRAILAAGREWSKHANITFADTSGDATLKLQFFDASNDPGSWSYVGTDALLTGPSEATINIGWPDDPARDLHELGHALGLIHEHQNPLARIPWNRMAVYAYYMGAPNYWTKDEVDQQVLSNDTEPLTNGGYDRFSIMEYPIPAELLTDPRYAVGWNQSLSGGDRSFIAKCYPKSSKPIPPPSPPTTSPPKPLPPTTPHDTGNLMDTLKAEVEKILAAISAGAADGHPVDFAKLQEVILAAFIAGGHGAIWPALQGRLHEFVTDPEVRKDVQAVLKAVNDPTLENEIAAALEVANSPLTKAVAQTVFASFKSLLHLGT